MLAELPFTTAEAIVAVHRPGARVTAKAALRTLTQKGLVSDGIGIRPRGTDGRVAGGGHVYSSLNLDAVRLHRHGDDDAARELARAAAAIERDDATRALATALAAAYRGGRSLPAALASVAPELLTPVVAATRRAHADAPVFARVARVDGEMVELRLEHGDAVVAVPRADLVGVLTIETGEGANLRWESLGGGMTLLHTAPAIEVAGGASTHPYDRPLPSRENAPEIPGVLRMAPTMRPAPFGIPLADSQ